MGLDGVLLNDFQMVLCLTVVYSFYGVFTE